MDTIIKTMPATAKVWIYQANRAFSEAEQVQIDAFLDNFVTGWNSHGKAIKGAFEIRYNQFIILMADENVASVSGCSIDSSVAVIREIEQKLGLNLLDKSKVAFLRENDTIELVDFMNIKQQVVNGNVVATTKTFNNMLTTFGDYQDNWIVEAKDSWLKRYF
ncbi:MAG: hypothetical protein GY827_03550 [Cytophagales bacterium]|nr:hypothetical protein [Cytophagales bacterium]